MSNYHQTLLEGAYSDLDDYYLSWTNALVVAARDIMTHRGNDAKALLDVAEFVTTLCEVRKNGGAA